MAATPSQCLRSADLSLWLEGWDRSASPSPLVEGITGVGLVHVGRAGARRVQVDCPSHVARHPQALAAFAELAARRARGGHVAIGLAPTPRGLARAQQLLWRGVSVGFGPVSTTATWSAAAECFTRALERRHDAGLPVDGITCVTWVPVGLIDAHSDRWLTTGSSLRGAAGIAISQLLYLLAFRTFAGARWARLRALGAQPPRLGWSRLSAERRSTYVSRLALPGSVIALGHPWAAELEGQAMDVAEPDETEAAWTSRELIGRGVPLDGILARLEAA